MDACSGFMRASVCHRVPPSYSIQQYRNRATVHGMYIKLYRVSLSILAARWSLVKSNPLRPRFQVAFGSRVSRIYGFVYATVPPTSSVDARPPPPAARRIAMGGGLDLRAQLN